MWKSLNPGDKVHPGDTIRYFSNLAYFKSSHRTIYDVIRADQHYFEIEARRDEAGNDEPVRKVIKYMDVGYHISLEIWSSNGQ